MDELTQLLHSHSEKFSADALSLFQRDENAGSLTLKYWVGEKPREQCPFGVTPLGECGQTGKPQHLEKRHQRKKFQSELFVPVSVNEEFWGVLACASYEPDHFKKSEVISQVAELSAEVAEILDDPTFY